jgi:NADH-quinone oxidoreductase subunit C
MAEEPRIEDKSKPAAALPASPKVPPKMAAEPWESELTRQLQARFPDNIQEFASYLGQQFLVASPDAVVAILEFLKHEADFDYLVDITAVDRPERAERFELVYILYSYSRNQRIRIRTSVAADFRPPSAVPVHPTANWLEREVFDMFGIEFAGHPYLRRILLPDGWHGHPLRKDYPILQQDQAWVKENLGIDSAQ